MLVHTYRICEEEYTEKLTKAKAIRKHCLGCCSGSQGEVAKCAIIHCPLFPFRFGNEKGLQRMEHLEEGYIDPDAEKYTENPEEVSEETKTEDPEEVSEETKTEDPEEIPVKKKRKIRIKNKKIKTHT